MIRIDLDVNLRELKDDIEKAMLEAVVEAVQDSVGGLRCATHKSSPSVQVSGSNAGEVSFKVSACCDEFIAEVTTKLDDL